MVYLIDRQAPVIVARADHVEVDVQPARQVWQLDVVPHLGEDVLPTGQQPAVFEPGVADLARGLCAIEQRLPVHRAGAIPPHGPALI